MEHRGMVNRGNWSRLKSVMERAERGEELVIGFFGGSITQGSLATARERCYAYRTFKWWEETFPQTQFHYVNGGIGGTSSLFGVSRAVTDLLMYRPDVVVVDFSVNDENTDFFQETYEGCIRRILKWDTKPAVILLNNVFYDTGDSAQDRHNQIGARYGLPCVSMRESLYQDIRRGIYRREDLTPDGLHPNDLGHQLLAEELKALLNRVYEERHLAEEEMPFPDPLTANAWEKAVRWQITNADPVLSGFRADTAFKEGFYDHFKQGWIGKHTGDGITFSIECENIAVQYRKTVRHPAPIARLILDGDTDHAVLLDGNFQETWGDCLYLHPVLCHGEKKTHEIRIEIVEATPEDAECFYLMSLITA